MIARKGKLPSATQRNNPCRLRPMHSQAIRRKCNKYGKDRRNDEEMVNLRKNAWGNMVVPQNAKKTHRQHRHGGTTSSALAFDSARAADVLRAKVYAGYTLKTDPFDVLEDQWQNVTPVAKTKETFECHPLKFQGKWKPRRTLCACEPNMGRITQAMAPPTVDQKTVLTPSDLDTTLEIRGQRRVPVQIPFGTVLL